MKPGKNNKNENKRGAEATINRFTRPAENQQRYFNSLVKSVCPSFTDAIVKITDYDYFAKYI